MTSLLENNLTALAKSDDNLAQKLHVAKVPPDFVVASAKSGRPTLIVRGVSFHSRIDPVEEAEKMLEALEKKVGTTTAPVAVFGLGLGYHVLSMAGVFKNLVVIEPNLGLIRLAFSLLDFRSALPGLEFQVQFTNWSPAPGTVFVPHNPSARMFRREFEYWSRVFKQDQVTGQGLDHEPYGSLFPSIPGLERIAGGEGQPAESDFKTLVKSVEKRRGELSPAEIYLLLLKELTLVD